MAWTPQLNITCGRCGKPRGLRHVCIARNNRKATVKAGWSFGQCPKCRKTVSNPLNHTCTPRSDYKRRRSAADKQARTERRNQQQSLGKVKRSRQRGPAKPKHDYQTCTDNDCQRPVCVAFKTGYKAGHQAGMEQDLEIGFDRGFQAGRASCPRPHK
jgi:hypothetical protein